MTEGGVGVLGAREGGGGLIRSYHYHTMVPVAYPCPRGGGGRCSARGGLGRAPRPDRPPRGSRASSGAGSFTNGASSGGASVGNLAAEAAGALGAREEALRAREAELEAREAKLHAERITLRATVTPPLVCRVCC